MEQMLTTFVMILGALAIGAIGGQWGAENGYSFWRTASRVVPALILWTALFVGLLLLERH